MPWAHSVTHKHDDSSGSYTSQALAPRFFIPRRHSRSWVDRVYQSATKCARAKREHTPEGTLRTSTRQRDRLLVVKVQQRSTTWVQTMVGGIREGDLSPNPTTCVCARVSYLRAAQGPLRHSLSSSSRSDPLLVL